MNHKLEQDFYDLILPRFLSINVVASSICIKLCFRVYGNIHCKRAELNTALQTGKQF